MIFQAYDLGKDPQSSNGTFKLTVNPFNYEEPKFSFPTEGTTLRLHKVSLNHIIDKRLGIFFIKLRFVGTRTSRTNA